MHFYYLTRFSLNLGQPYYFFALWPLHSASVTSAASPACLSSRFSWVVSSSSSWSLLCSWSVIQMRRNNKNKTQITDRKVVCAYVANYWLPFHLITFVLFHKSNSEAVYNFLHNFNLFKNFLPNNYLILLKKYIYISDISIES